MKKTLLAVFAVLSAGSWSMAAVATAVTATTTVNQSKMVNLAPAKTNEELLAAARADLEKLDVQIAALNAKIAKTNAQIKASPKADNSSLRSSAELDMISLQSVVSKRAKLLQLITIMIASMSDAQKKWLVTWVSERSETLGRRFSVEPRRSRPSERRA